MILFMEDLPGLLSIGQENFKSYLSSKKTCCPVLQDGISFELCFGNSKTVHHRELSMGAYYLKEKSSWGVESITLSHLPVYRRIATSVTV